MSSTSSSTLPGTDSSTTFPTQSTVDGPTSTGSAVPTSASSQSSDFTSPTPTSTASSMSTSSPSSSPQSSTGTLTETASSTSTATETSPTETATTTETSTSSSEAQTSTSSSQSSTSSTEPTTTMSTASDSSITSVSSTDTNSLTPSNTDVTSTTSTDTSSDTTAPPSTTTATETSTTTTEPSTTTGTTTSTSEPPTTTTAEPSTTSSSNPPGTTQTTETTTGLPTTTTATTTSSESEETSTSTALPPSTTITESSTTFVAEETTLSSTLFFTVTANGTTTTSAPSQFTSILTSTNSDGQISTITQIVVNPTLSSEGDGGSSEFFKNKGAVAGVFLIVGLAAASICIWVIFFVRRRRRKRLLEREAAMVVPTGHRSPLEGEDDEPRMLQNAAVPLTARPPSAYFDSGAGPHINDGVFDPYVGYPQPRVEGNSRDGYVPARTSSPPPGGLDTTAYRLGGHQRQPSGQSNSNTSAEHGAHSRSYSFSSYEPLLAAAGIGNKTPPDTPGPTQDSLGAPTPPPRNPLRPTASRSDEGGNTGANADGRLDPAMESRLARAGTNASGIRDDEDYSRPVLGVRNVPSNISISEYSDDEK